jgi:predicted NAD/FAD-binding protein
MMAAIWSKNKEDTLKCSAYFILKFYNNHGLLDLFNRPTWYVVKHGSNNYIAPMIENFKTQIHLNAQVEKIIRVADKVKIIVNSKQCTFDAVVCATHSYQALSMLDNPTIAELNILSAIKYTKNSVVLHTDKNVMPKNKRAWASWNYLDNRHLQKLASEASTLTYYMNRLQSIQAPDDFFVSVNLSEEIADDKIIQSFQYAHPCLNVEALQAQKQLALINGSNNTYYVGSYWGYGFHEDGVTSAINTCKLLGC